MNNLKRFKIFLFACAIFFVGGAHAQEVILNGTINNGVIVTINGKHQVIRNGETNIDGVKLVTAGRDDAIFEINGKKVTLKIDTNYVANQRAEPSKTIVRIPSSNGGHYRTPGRINGQAVDFMVDTGATIIAMNLQTAQSLGINYRAGERVSIATANGTAIAYKVMLSSVSVGTLEIKNVEAAVNIGDSPREILLGNSYLSRVNMRRDSGVLVLEAMY